MKPQQVVQIPPPANSSSGSEDWVMLVRAALQEIRFGSVTLVVQDGLVVQVDRLEKRRLHRSTRRP
jgi:hypothetical protein